MRKITRSTVTALASFAGSSVALSVAFAADMGRPPVYAPPPDRGPITAVVITAAGLAIALGLGAMARHALRRR